MVNDAFLFLSRIQLQSTGGFVLSNNQTVEYTEASTTMATADASKISSEVGQLTSVTNLYDTTSSMLTQEQKAEEETSTWLDFCIDNSTKDISATGNSSGSFAEPLPPSNQAVQHSGDQEVGDKRSSNSTNQHSKLRGLLFDMEDEEDEEDEVRLPDAESMAVRDVDLDSTRVISHGSTGEMVQSEKMKNERLSKGATTGLPTAIVVPTAYSISTTVSNGVPSNTASPLTCCNVDDTTKEGMKEESTISLAASKRKHGHQESGYSLSISVS